ncbi:CENPA (predicted) [Pycnogonum litorale]
MTVFKNKCHNLTGTTILLVLLLYGVIHAAPVRENTNEIGLDLSTSSGSSIILAFVSLAFFVTIVTLLAGCICCKYPRFKGFINARNGISQSSSRSTSFTNRPNSSEFTIFPPEGAMVTMQPIRADTSDIKFEPLPEIKMYNRHEISSVSSTNLLPAAYGNVIGRGVSVGDWFDAPHTNFPRSQLKYLKEVGYGWFGEVVEGQAYGIIPTTKDCKVIVKILREDSTPSDHIFFLSEVKCFRDLSHPNLLTLLGQCLESDPYLLLFEHCYHNDLKSYLIKNRSDKMELFDGNGLLNWSCQIADGLQHMHQNGFVHFDLAARNCLLTRQLQIKVGDYGNTIYTYKDDYYCIGDVALPLRWSSPESLTCNKTTIETKDTTQSANVWSFGVVLWELLEFGAMPYSSMSNEEVLQKVIIDGDLCLERPANDCVHNDRLCDIMSLCLQVAANHRPSMQKVFFVLKYLSENVNALEELSNEFEKRWSALRLPDYKEHNLPTKITASEKSKMKFDSDFHPSVLADRDSLLTDHSPVQDIDISFKSSMTGLESGEFSPNIVSPSLQNLRGSIEDITAAAPDESAINPTPGIEQESSDFIDEHITTHVAGVDTTKGDIPREGESVSKSIARLGSLEELRSGQRSRDMMAEKSKNVMNFLKLTVIDSDISDQDSPMHRRSPSSPNSNANHSFIRHRPANVSNARGDSLHDVCSGGGGGTNAIRNGANKDEFHPCRNSPKRGDQSSPFIDPEQSVLTSTPKRRNSSPKSETEFNRDETTYTTALDSSVSSYLTAVQSLPLDGSNSTVAATSYDSTAGIVSEERHSSGSADRRDASLDSQEIRDLISESFTFLDKSEGGENDDAVGASFRTLRPKDSFDKELEEFDSVCNSYEGASRPNTKAPDILLARKSVDDGEIRSSSSEEEWTCGLDDEESAESFGGNDRNRHEMIPREIPRVISYPPPEEIVAKKEWICGSEKPVKDGLDLDSIRKGKLIPREIPREISYPAPEEIVAKKEWICGSEKPVNDGLRLGWCQERKVNPAGNPT